MTTFAKRVESLVGQRVNVYVFGGQTLHGTLQLFQHQNDVLVLKDADRPESFVFFGHVAAVEPVAAPSDRGRTESFPGTRI